MNNFANQLERKIKRKISAISNGIETVENAGVNLLIAKLKIFDEAAAEYLQRDYIDVVKNFNNSQKC